MSKYENNQIDDTDIVKIMLLLMQAKEAKLIVDTLSQYNTYILPSDCKIVAAKKNYDELEKQISELEMAKSGKIKFN